MTLNVGINGFGRIGRIIFRTCFQNPGLKVSAINDPAVDINYICYLIKFDSTHGKFCGTVNRSENEIFIDGHKIAIFRETHPINIPWQKTNVEYVVEASGMFTSLEKASGHLASEGVKRVLVTAPSVDVPMVVLGVNDDKLGAGHKVVSCASSTLYCLAPLIKILEEHFGVSEGFITSIHAMTPSLKPLDGLCLKGKHWRDHRSIHQNIIPATTGACRALGRIIPQVKDKMTGLAFRVPIVNVSVLDITIRLKSSTSMESIVRLVENAGNSNMQNIIKISNEQAVSSDFIGDTYSCILDLDSSLQLTPDFFKLICWYENEHSYACRVIDSIFFLERQHQFERHSKMSYIKSTPKQSFVQHRETRNKFTYHQACTYECHSNSKSLCCTSEDGFKSPKRSMTKKLASPLNFSIREFPLANKAVRKKSELFEKGRDEDKTPKASLSDRGTTLHSCIPIIPQNNTAYVKTRERLENVKKEFSKMVIMTENLLKQSQQSKIEIGLSEIPPNNAGDTIKEKTKLCDDYTFPINKTSQYIETIADDNNEEMKPEYNTFTTRQQEETINNNTFLINEELISNMNHDICDTRVKIDKRSCSMETLDIHNHRQTTYGNIEECTLDSKDNISNDVSNNLNSDNNGITENITIADTNDVTRVLTSNSPFKEQNDCPNHIVGEHLSIHSQDETSLIEKLCSVTKEKELSNSVKPITKDKNIFRQTDTNKNEAKITNNKDKQGRDLQRRLEGVLKKLTLEYNVIPERTSTRISSINTITTASNRDIKHKQDIYDKLDSVSATDSENSFHMKERKSQVINIADLTNSLEDLERLDKICRIMEISDELSDQLLSALNSNECRQLKNKKWSFKDLCEKIKLDDFCNKMFSKSNC